MKIIAKTADKFIVEMTADEIAKSAGYRSTYDDAWEKANHNSRAPLIGTEIDVNAAYTFHSQIATHQHKAKEAAGALKALSTMLENGIPDAIIKTVTDAEVMSDDTAS